MADPGNITMVLFNISAILFMLKPQKCLAYAILLQTTPNHYLAYE